MVFVYNEEMQCYCMEVNDILFSCETPDIHYETIAGRLAEKYESRLPLIAEYIVHQDKFIKVYGEISREEMLEMFEEMTIPWIFLSEDNSGTIAYGNPDHVIDFSFTGEFERFSDLSIDS